VSVHRARAIALVLAGVAAAACHSASTTTRGGPRSIVLVTIDTWRADRVSADVAPELARFAASGVQFTAARTAVPLTLPSHATLLTGQLPPSHGVRVNGDVLPGDVPTLATALRSTGYRTAAFVGAYALDRRFGLARGFDTYSDQVVRDWRRADRLEAERPAAAVIDAAIAWLDQAPADPFLLWVHLYDPHAPYDPPEPFRHRFRDRPYDGEVAYASAEIGRLLTRLDTRGRLADSVVVLAGDHGEGLGEHGEATHGMLAYDSTLRVPLVVRAPGLAAGTNRTAVSLADVASAVLRLSQSGARLAAASPRDLFDGDMAAEVYAETAYPVVAGWHPVHVLAGVARKLVRSAAVELYDIEADRGELADLAPRDPAAVRAAVARLTRATPAATRGAAASPDADARLRSLGYASGPANRSVSDDAPNPATTIAAWSLFEQLSIANGTSADLATLATLARDHPRGYVFVTAYARALSARGRHIDAMRVLQSATERFAAEPALFHDLAVASREAGVVADALGAERAALALDDRYAAAHHGLGLLHADAQRPTDAVAAFQRAVDLDPANAAYLTDLGNAQRDAGDGQAAADAYDRALAIDGAYADAANGRGVLLVQAGRPSEAVGWFLRALAADATLHQARLNLGIAYQQSARRDLAVQAYREVLRTAPRTATRERQSATDLLRTLR
jgi:choline-sulfatase